MPAIHWIKKALSLRGLGGRPKSELGLLVVLAFLVFLSFFFPARVRPCAESTIAPADRRDSAELIVVRDADDTWFVDERSRGERRLKCKHRSAGTETQRQ